MANVKNLKEPIIEILNIDEVSIDDKILENIKNMLDKVQFLKFEKYTNGSFRAFDKILFKENLKKVLFVEEISDKFILEGLKKSELFKKLRDYYIPLSGGDKLEDNEIVKKSNYIHAYQILKKRN